MCKRTHIYNHKSSTHTMVSLINKPVSQSCFTFDKAWKRNSGITGVCGMPCPLANNLNRQ